MNLIIVQQSFNNFHLLVTRLGDSLQEQKNTHVTRISKYFQKLGRIRSQQYELINKT